MRSARIHTLELREQLMSESRELIQSRTHKAMLDTLNDCKHLLETKGHDYGMDNFLRASVTATSLTRRHMTPSDVAACLLGIKLARYAELTTKGKKPENESLHDTVVDLINYILLMERERRTDEVFNRKQADEVEEAG